MTEGGPRKIFSARVPAWILREVSANYANVSEFTERALITQLQLDRQRSAIETLAGDGDRERGRELLDAVEAEAGHAKREAAWRRQELRAERQVMRRQQPGKA